MECFINPDDSVKMHESDVNLSLRTDSSTAGDIDDVFDTSVECADTNAGFTGRCVVTRGRRLDFTHSSRESSPEGNVSTDSIPVIRLSHDDSTDSPPYKRVRTLRLMDSPATPKTLLAQSSTPRTPLPARTFIPVFREGRFLERLSVPTAGPTTLTPKDKPVANLNPFTPTGMMLTSKKRRRSALSLTGSPDKSGRKNAEVFMDSEDSDIDGDSRPAKLALREANIPRYSREFIEEELIGEGEFGSVYRCTNRLDGMEYAIKKSIKPVRGSSSERVALNEVYAHAVLGKHPNVVSYFSAWAEDDHMIIQNEYCNGGSLAQAIERHRAHKTHFSEADLRKMLRQLAEGLRYFHAGKLVHMDIKPANIFISTDPRLLSIGYESADDNAEEEESGQVVTYKIGDLGHVTSVENPMVEEGDCRYLSMEVLREKYDHLPKADIFALGLTMFEAAGGGPLPKNGPAWHEMREGKLPELPHYSKEFHELLSQMIDPNPESRPTATALLSHRFVNPLGNQSKAQLLRRLKQEMIKVDILSQKLQQTSQFVTLLVSQQQPALRRQPPALNTRASRVIGRKANRSQSANCL